MLQILQVDECGTLLVGGQKFEILVKTRMRMREYREETGRVFMRYVAGNGGVTLRRYHKIIGFPHNVRRNK
jgi:ABC-type arginine transport system ATPase subunit